jgi:hypothetical protein
MARARIRFLAGASLQSLDSGGDGQTPHARGPSRQALWGHGCTPKACAGSAGARAGIGERPRPITMYGAKEPHPALPCGEAREITEAVARVTTEARCSSWSRGPGRRAPVHLEGAELWRKVFIAARTEAGPPTRRASCGAWARRRRRRIAWRASILAGRRQHRHGAALTHQDPCGRAPCSAPGRSSTRRISALSPRCRPRGCVRSRRSRPSEDEATTVAPTGRRPISRCGGRGWDDLARGLGAKLPDMG